MKSIMFVKGNMTLSPNRMQHAHHGIEYSLKSIYGRILTEDITYAASHHIEDKLWRYICYPNIEEVRSKLRKVKQQG